MADEGKKESFIAALTELGGSAVNGRLRYVPHSYKADYSDTKEELVAAELFDLTDFHAPYCSVGKST
jgi:hypothetical protein